jgi:hypothetical protein
LKRADNLLNKNHLNDDDQHELKELTSKFKDQKLAGNETAASKTENELLELLYYLEDDH